MTSEDHPDPTDELLAPYWRRDDELRSRWQRSLPPADALVDRWERARRLGFGARSSIYGSAYVFGDVTVGEDTWIGPMTMLDGSGGGIVIGRFCSVSTGVQIYTHDTVRWALSMGVAERRTGPVRVGDGCHLGAQSVVAPGVAIGSMVVVAAGSFVRADVDDRTVVAGNPAAPIGTVVGDGTDVRMVIDGGAPRPG